MFLVPRGLILTTPPLKRFDKWVESHPPFREIPDEYIPEDEFSETPLFLWGLPFSQEQALAYAIRYNLRCKDGHPCFLPNRVIDHLANKRDFVLDCRNPLSQVHKNLVVLYTNFNMLWRHLSLEQEEEIIEVLREELGIPMEVQPLWYWDKDTCGPRYA